MPGTQILRLRRKAQKRVDLPLLIKLRRLYHRVDDPVDILCRLEPNIGRHRSRIHVLARSQALHAHALAFKVRNAADAFVSKQFEAADMYPRQQGDLSTTVDRDGEGRGKADREIGVAGP